MTVLSAPARPGNESPWRDHSPPLLVRRETELIALAAAQLGFHPQDSLVLMACQGSRLEFTARFDLAPLLETSQLGDWLTPLLERGDAIAVDRWLGLIYAPPPRSDRLAVRLRLVLGNRLDRLLANHQGRWWDCDQPAVGGELDTARPGLEPFDPVQADRAACVAALAPPSGSREDEVLEQRHRLAEVWADRPEAEWVVRAEAILAQPAWDGLQGGRGAIPDQDLGPASGLAGLAGPAPLRSAYLGPADDPLLLGVLVESAAVRDRLWRSLDETTAKRQLALWREVVRQAAPGHRLLPLCLLGLVAWVAGEGVVMSICHQEAYQLDRRYPLVQVLTAIRERLIPPCTWRQVLDRASGDSVAAQVTALSTSCPDPASGFDSEG